MTIRTGRFKTTAEVSIDHDKCTLCGLCLKVCKGMPLYLEKGQILVDQSRLYGCIGCGHCAAVCPVGAVSVQGRDFSPADLESIGSADKKAGYEELMGLFRERRSVRNFQGREVAAETVEKILAAAAAAPMGLPPSDVEALVLHGREKVDGFSADFTAYIKKVRWMLPFLFQFFRLFMKKEEYRSFRDFVLPLTDILIKGREQGVDWLLYGAPLAIYFHTSAVSDPADPLVAATYAMVAAESLALGSCMIGSIGPFLKSGGKEIKEKYQIPLRNQQGIMVIFGYPEVKFNKSIRRRLAGIKYF